MKKTHLSLAALTLAAAAAAPAFAGDAYVLGAVGRSNADLSQSNLDAALTAAGATGVSSSIDKHDTGGKLQFGYQYNPNFAVEAGYVDLGKAKYSANFTGGNASAEWKAHGWNVAALGIVPLSSDWSLFGKLGVIDAKVEATASASGAGTAASRSASATKWVPNYGLGATYALTKATALRFEWERFQKLGDDDTNGKTNVDLASLGVAWKF